MFWLKKKVLLKNHKQLSNDTFKPEPNKKNGVHKKLFNLEIYAMRSRFICIKALKKTLKI